MALALGDHWIADGALAISAFAAANLAATAHTLSVNADAEEALTDAAVALWLPPLVGAEMRHPRLRLD